ncbi:septum formation initiator family protein [bacterium BFN5]|nr:septum formation initiator family protein [bacterium BFN5]QJW45792.1 septum formation initiator family protein [bacterium BFN5]
MGILKNKRGNTSLIAELKTSHRSIGGVPVQRRRSKLRVKWFRLVLLSIFGYFIYICFNQYSQISAINQEKEAVKLRLEQAREVNANLTEERKRLNDRAYIEKLAREELGLAKPGETPYIPSGKN